MLPDRRIYMALVMWFNRPRYVRSLASRSRPNIIGHASSFASWAGGEFDGVLIKYDGGNANISGGPGEAIGATVGFDAHNGNSSFGASETVQPPALLGLACIKT